MSTMRMSISLLVAAVGAASACSRSSVGPLPQPEPTPGEAAAWVSRPISGGTLHVTQQGLAVAADSDRDVVWLVDLPTRAVRKVALQAGDEPGRVAEDDAGRAHVALRGAGALATIDLASAAIVRRTEVCSAPRGLAYDAATDRIHVACAGGELVTLAAGDGAIVRSLRLDRDLRDVLVQGDRLIVTRFKSAEILVVDAKGSIVSRSKPPQAVGMMAGPPPDAAGGPQDPAGNTFTPTVAWRAIPLAGGGAALLHQRSFDGTIDISNPGGYGSSDPCGEPTVVDSTVTLVDADGNLTSPGQPSPSLLGASLAVDLATDGHGHFAVASAGNGALLVTTAAELAQGPAGCGGGGQAFGGEQVVAVGFWNGAWVAQAREPAGLVLYQTAGPGGPDRIDLPADSVADAGHDLFHRPPGKSALACASCHPEGHEDGHLWSFDTIGARRTQTVTGGVLATAPLHWDGDMKSFEMIMHEVFERRMGGEPQSAEHVTAFASWVQGIPAFPASPSGTRAQIEHGERLFSSAGCGSCHGGQHLTNNQNADVGTGRSFQVPSLIGVAARAPFMHDGCAATLHDRFDPAKASCNGGDHHGRTSDLAPSDIDDLVAYLETL